MPEVVKVKEIIVHKDSCKVIDNRDKCKDKIQDYEYSIKDDQHEKIIKGYEVFYSRK